MTTMTDKRQAASRAGFTLVELLVVVAILAIVASFAISQFSTTQKTSAEKVSIANQEAVNRAVQSYLMINGGTGLNYLDSLIDWGTALGTVGTFSTNLNSTTVVGGVYRGPKQVSFSDTSAPGATAVEQNHGMASDLASKVCVYYLSSSDVASLKKLGLTRAIYFNYTTLHASSRGGLTVTPEMEIIDGGPAFRVEHAPSFGVALTNGTPVLAIKPAVSTLSLYKAFGSRLYATNGVAGANGVVPPPSTDAEAMAAASGKVLLLFGLGEDSTLIGARNGGLDNAPRCEALDYSYYRQYLLVVRCMSGASALNAGAEFAGVLDPKGQTVSDARFSNEWRNGDR